MFLLQHGYGKSDKIEQLDETGNLRGVILSPAHEDVMQLSGTVARCQALGIEVLLDPQSYIYSTNPPGFPRRHPAHGLHFSDTVWSLSAKQLSEHVESVRRANATVGLNGPIIAPSPFHLTLRDYWMPLAVQYARTATDAWGGENTFASIVVSELALADWATVADWLDVLTTLDVAGFYLLVSRQDQSYPPATWQPQSLANLLRLVYTLAVENEYDVRWGYSDIDGLLGIAAGANGVASGWSYSLRQFSIQRYSESRGGGNPAVPRVYVASLMSDLRFSEARDLFGSEVGHEMFSPPLQATYASRSFDALGNPDAQIQHLCALAEEVVDLSQFVDVDDRLTALRDKVAAAMRRHAEVAGMGVTLDGRYVARLRSYDEALGLFYDATAR